MGKGSCYCGKVSFTFAGEPINKVICHCTDCKKISGSAYSTNLIVSSKDFTMTGTPKKYTARAASGRNVTTVFCGDCGSPLWREGELSDPQGQRVVRVGCLDGEGAVSAAKPLVEIYTCDKAGWVGVTEEAEQFEGMFV